MLPSKNANTAKPSLTSGKCWRLCLPQWSTAAGWSSVWSARTWMTWPMPFASAPQFRMISWHTETSCSGEAEYFYTVARKLPPRKTYNSRWALIPIIRHTATSGATWRPWTRRRKQLMPLRRTTSAQWPVLSTKSVSTLTPSTQIISARFLTTEPMPYSELEILPKLWRT